MRALLSCLLLPACLWIGDEAHRDRKEAAPGVDSGRIDSGPSDSGTSDSGPSDSGTSDSGTTDGGGDSGAGDGGTTDPRAGAYVGTVVIDCEYGTAGLLRDTCRGTVDLELGPDGGVLTGDLSCTFEEGLSDQGVQLADLVGTLRGSGTLEGTADFSGGAILADADFMGSYDDDAVDVIDLSFAGRCEPDDDFAGDYSAEVVAARP